MRTETGRREVREAPCKMQMKTRKMKMEIMQVVGPMKSIYDSWKRYSSLAKTGTRCTGI